MKTMKVRVTFLEEVLGLSPSDPETFEKYISPNMMNRNPNSPEATREEEISGIPNMDVDEETQVNPTVFLRNSEGIPSFMDYQIKGFFKDSIGMLRKVPNTKSSKIKAYKKEIDGLVFVSPRFIPFQFTGDTGICSRPLRASTAKGERIALAISETVPAGATIEFEVECWVDSYVEVIKECLDYGKRRGMSQWRNSGKGIFTYEILYIE